MQSWMMGMVLGLVGTGFLPVLPPFNVSLLILVVLPPGLWSKHPIGFLLAGAVCGSLLGIIHGHALLEHRLAESCVGKPLTIEGRIVSLPTQKHIPDVGMRQGFEFSVRHVTPQACAGPRRLQLYFYRDEALVPGERWRLGVRLKKPWGQSNPGGFNWQAWFALRGIDGTGSVRGGGPHQRLESPGTFAALHHRIRQRVSSRIDVLELPPAVRAVLRAVTVADKSGVDGDLWLLFQQFGINHLLVISGLHVGLVAGLGYLLGGVCARVLRTASSLNRILPGLSALLAAGLFSALAGFSLPALRALVMLACFVLASLLARQSVPWHNLLLAAVVVLLLNPLAAIGSGFWLSFGAVAALLWLGPWQAGRGRLGRLLGTHATMALLMLPLGALFSRERASLRCSVIW